MYDSYIFDIDGTLIDTERIILSALQQLIKEEHGKNVTKNDLSFAMAMTSLQTLQKLNFKDLELANMKWLNIIKKLASSIEPFDGIENTIKQLRSHNKKLGIVTSKTRNEIAYDIQLTPIYQLFDVVITASDTLHPKPHPSPLLKCLKLLETTPQYALYIGDTSYDAKCAEQAGVDFGIALWGAKDHAISGAYSFLHPEDILKRTLL